MTVGKPLAAWLTATACVVLTLGALPRALALDRVPEPYGRSLLRIEENKVGCADCKVAADAVVAPEPALSEREAYRDKLAAMQEQGGPYAIELSEPLIDLGRYHAARGEYAAAQGYYRRALHVMRINDGLNNLVQIPVLRALLATFRASGDYKALDRRYEYFFRLHGNGEPPLEGARLQASLEYLDWQREALRRGLDGDNTVRLLDTFELNEDLLEALGEQREPSYEAWRALTLSQLQNIYLLLAHPRPLADPFEGTLRRGYPDPFERELDYQERHLLNLQQSALSRGTSLLGELIDRAGRESTEELAAAQREFGDWYQWNGRYDSAAEYYARAQRTAREAGREDLAGAWFDSPVELPAHTGIAGATPEASFVATVRFNVTEYGRARDIEPVSDIEEEKPRYWRLKKRLADLRFRPVLHDGETVASEVAGRRYRLLE